MEPNTISAQERKRLDRQRFIGWETQQKLLNSRILITPANGPNTELAKNLILAGVNITLYDDATVTDDDFESNFLIAQEDIGKPRSEAVFCRLKDMNPSGKNEVFNENLLERVDKLSVDDLKRYSLVATSSSDFGLIQKWDTLTKKANLPYFNSVCCGLHAFAFISLGSQYCYHEIDKKTKKISKSWSVKSLALEEAIQWKGAQRSKEFIAAIQMMYESQKQGLVYDPFNGDEVLLGRIVQLGVNLVGEKHRELLTNFTKTFGLDFCPVYSVIGSILSQEVIKIVENQTEPGMNWLVFNSEQGYGSIVKIAPQKERVTSSVVNQ